MKTTNELLKIYHKTSVSLFSLLLLLAANTTFATDYHNWRTSIEVEVISVDQKIAKKIIPIVRPYIARNGHLAAVEGTNSMVIADHAGSLTKIIPILTSLTLENFEPEKLKSILANALTNRTKKTTKVIKLKNRNAKEIIPAIRVLVSYDGSLIPNAELNELEITDHPEYIASLEKLIRRLDKP